MVKSIIEHQKLLIKTLRVHPSAHHIDGHLHIFLVFAKENVV